MAFTFIIKETGEKITLPIPNDKPCKIDTFTKEEYEKMCDYTKKQSTPSHMKIVQRIHRLCKSKRNFRTSLLKAGDNQ